MDSLLIAVPLNLLDARIGTGVSDTIALPTRLALLTWQTSFDVAPAVIDIDIDISLDGVIWTTIDTSTNVSGEVRTITNPSAAVFIRANVNTNTGNRQVTLILIGKVSGFLQSLQPYLQLSDSTDQQPGVTTPIQATFDTEDSIFGFTHSGGDITILKSGTYLVIASAQAGKTSGTAVITFDMWLRVNATDVPNTGCRTTVIPTAETKLLIAEEIINLVAGDVLKVMFSVSNTAVGAGLISSAPAGEAAIPSIMISATRLG